MKFLRKLLEKRRHQRYVAGYDWAAGGVLRGDITPSDVDAYTVGKGNDPFDRGAIAALFAISRLKRIEVNLQNQTEEYDWMEEARVIAAQCWCDKRVEDREMDVEFAEVIAERIASWMQTVAQNQHNTDYYRGLLEQCGKTIGDRSYTADDGTRMDDVLCAKIPEIIATDYIHGGG